LTIGTPSLASFLIAASSHLSAGGSGVVLVVLEVVVGVRVEEVVLAPALQLERAAAVARVSAETPARRRC